jgi:hypothetical protein
MAKKTGGYWFGSSWIVSLILAIIPGVNWFLGVAHRIVKGNILGAVVYILLGSILGFVDFITILVANEIVLLA